MRERLDPPGEKSRECAKSSNERILFIAREIDTSQDRTGGNFKFTFSARTSVKYSKILKITTSRVWREGFPFSVAPFVVIGKGARSPAEKISFVRSALFLSNAIFL